MMNRPIDGTVVEATRRRQALGAAVFENVVIRRADGELLTFPRLSVSPRLAEQLRAENSGRFYMHDVGGMKGMHAFTGNDAALPDVFFPMLAERLSGLVALFALALTVTFIMNGNPPFFGPLVVGVIATACWAMFRASRQSILHDLAHTSRQSVAALPHRAALA